MKYLLLFLMVAGVACNPTTDQGIRDVQGYKPIYASLQEVNAIGIGGARPTVHAGKIYAYGNYLFQVEENEGIHIINNANPQQAQKLGFLKVPTCSEISIKANYLYTNNLNDLVVFDISNINAPQLVKRLENAFPALSQEYPPFQHAYFECPDPAKGTVIGWTQTTLSNPKCRR
jgi:hypothetical protein